MMKSFNPEILAPVGNGEMLVSAVRSGADAVYLGAENFNARRSAENFSAEDLIGAVKYCHTRGVLVYLTLNIAIKDDEIEEALETAKRAYLSGIDGVIVSDLGLAHRLHKQFPDLPLHASTQMSVMSPSALPILKELGFKRVVVSREMTKEGIREFTRTANEMGIETEVFVHGALCMSVSGQCLLSAVIGGRSGNRGLCAGPCRLPFSSACSEYALSLKDLSLLNYVAELKEMGVASLKIEGRMKRPEYVAAAVAAFKAALNQENDASLLTESLQNVFSRSGFTDGYYKNKIGANMFGIRTKEDVLASNDAITKIHALYRAERQSVGITLSVEIKAEKPVRLTVSDGKNSVSVTGKAPSAALNKALEKSGVEAYLSKLGGTPYFAEKIEINLDEGLFLSSADLNALRRNAIEELSALRSAVREVREEPYTPCFADKKAEKTELFCRFESIEQIPENLKDTALVILPIDADFEGAELPHGTEIAVEIPRGILNEKPVFARLEALKNLGVKTAFCGTLAAMQLALKLNFQVIADVGFNLYNSNSAAVLENSGAVGAVISPELKAEELCRVKSPLKKGYFAYGRLPLMLTKNCPVKEGSCENCGRDKVITDRMGINFPVRCRGGFAEVLNSRPIYLADKQNDFLGIDFAYLYFTVESRSEAAEIIDAYQKRKKPTGEFTRGLYYRTVY